MAKPRNIIKNPLLVAWNHLRSNPGTTNASLCVDLNISDATAHSYLTQIVNLGSATSVKRKTGRCIKCFFTATDKHPDAPNPIQTIATNDLALLDALYPGARMAANNPSRLPVSARHITEVKRGIL